MLFRLYFNSRLQIATICMLCYYIKCLQVLIKVSCLSLIFATFFQDTEMLIPYAACKFYVDLIVTRLVMR